MTVMDSSRCCIDGTMTIHDSAFHTRTVPCFQHYSKKPVECMNNLWKKAGCLEQGKKFPGRRYQTPKTSHMEVFYNSAKYVESVNIIRKLALLGGAKASYFCFGEYFGKRKLGDPFYIL